MFSYFKLNYRYSDAEVMVSLAKMKNHVTAGVTLSMKNMFGITPNSLYGTEAGTRGEAATAYRGCLHTRAEGGVPELPGELSGFEDQDAYFRVPRIVTDLVAARPVHLAIIDVSRPCPGARAGGTTPVRQLAPLDPGVLIAGLNPVATDAVAARVMATVTRSRRAERALRLLRQPHPDGPRRRPGDGRRLAARAAGRVIESVATRFAWI